MSSAADCSNHLRSFPLCRNIGIRRNGNDVQSTARDAQRSAIYLCCQLVSGLDYQ